MSVSNNARCFCDLKDFERPKGRDGNPPSESDRRRMQRIQKLASDLVKWFAEDMPPIQDSQQSNPEEGTPQ